MVAKVTGRTLGAEMAKGGRPVQDFEI